MAQLNLTNLYGSYIHVPTIKGSSNRSPLYALSGSDTQADELKNLNRDPEWIKHSEVTYNSPTNVRRIIATDQSVTIQFYKPFIHNGKPSTEGNWRTRSLAHLNLDKAKENLANQYLSQQGADLAYSKNQSVDKFTGSPLLCIKTPWVLSNIEEIIIDETCLFSNKITETVLSPVNVAKLFIAKRVGGLYKNPNALISRLLNMDAGAIKNQFPRLKSITIVPDLANKTKGLEYNLLLKGNIGTLYDKLIEIGVIEKNNCVHAEYIPSNAIDKGNITTRTYYKFDKEVLSKFAREFEQTLSSEREAIREQARIELEAKVESLKTPFEKELDRIASESGIEVAIMIYDICEKSLQKEDRSELRLSFTKSGVDKYAKG